MLCDVMTAKQQLGLYMYSCIAFLVSIIFCIVKTFMGRYNLLEPL